MALTITNIVREGGATCDHRIVTINHEGTIRTFKSSLSDIDALIDELGGPLPAMEALTKLWVAYRRRNGRAFINVDIG